MIIILIKYNDKNIYNNYVIIDKIILLLPLIVKLNPPSLSPDILSAPHCNTMQSGL